ncbi:hypothetical protein OU798_22665 [Prolixibacteraceae bacterium Z1-6]|uniref:Uncharacterized protein n=1 Tax=Draconibacterium aestuarii TaxID=2998507 RepID=A0A9X3F9R7_9BACT|nr:hypothetical protein [Prolixibacteraceae bacterium Z1-6]
MKEQDNYTRWMFILFPAVSMMLGWGLRGHIGGGPFGAMIPGAMVALSIGMLLKLPVKAVSVLLVLGIAGIGLGGEMTYGQTLGFLKNPDTVWWGTAGTTTKGAVWGFLGGAVFALGLIFKRISTKKLIVAFLMLFAGILIGFNLINDPMILYFSYPEKPRAESWAGLLFGAVFLLTYLKYTINTNDFKIVFRFALWGLLGGGLGFGLGGFWLVMGSHFPDVIFTNWWKAMEFSFGFLLGASLGYAAWQNRTELKQIGNSDWIVPEKPFKSVYKELALIFAAGIITYWMIPNLFEPFVDGANNTDGFVLALLRNISRIVVNYAFYGFLFVLALICFPKLAWQLGITLTFSHAAIDLIRDFYPDTDKVSPFTSYFLIVVVLTAIVALLVVYFNRKENTIKNMFLLLIWSCVAVSFARLSLHPEKMNIEGLSFYQVICGRFIVDIFFAVSAVLLSVVIKKRFKE